MKDSFLTGNFLVGRESVFQHSTSGSLKGVSDERLETAFGERTSRLRNRHGQYFTTVQGSLVLALMIMVVAFTVDFQPETEFLIAIDEPEVPIMEEIEQTEQIVKPPPPPRPPVPIEVPNDEILEEDVLALDAEIDFDEPLELPPPPPVDDNPEPEIFVVVEEMPEMVGGIESLYGDLRYPEVARLAGLEGNVVIELLIDESGVPSNPKVLRSAGDILDDAAVDALLKQRFKPGRQRGKAVKVRMAFPVRFKLG
jgi:protein TonB